MLYRASEKLLTSAGIIWVMLSWCAYFSSVAAASQHFVAEHEPNNKPLLAQWIRLGETIEAKLGGAVDGGRDVDNFKFRVDATISLVIEIVPASDMDADIRIGRVDDKNSELDFRIKGVTSSESRFEFTPGLYRIQLNPNRASVGKVIPYRLSLKPRPYRLTADHNNAHSQLILLPSDGKWSSHLGGVFSPIDQIYVGLPEGEGLISVYCDGGRVVAKSLIDDSVLARALDRGAVYLALPYGPHLGGAVLLEVEKDEDKQWAYECQVNFLEEVPGVREEVLVSGENQIRLNFGESLRVPLPLSSKFDIVLAGAAADEEGFRCTYADGSAPDRHYFSRTDSGGRDHYYDAGTGMHYFRGQSKAESKITVDSSYVSPDHKSKYDAFICRRYIDSNFKTLAEFDRLAKFDAFDKRIAGKSKETKPMYAVPPFPKDGQTAIIPASQLTEGLDVTAKLSAGEIKYATYFGRAQVVDVSVSIRNNSKEATNAAAYFYIAGTEGWTVIPERKELNLAADESKEVKLSIQAPPMLSADSKPFLITKIVGKNQVAGIASPVEVGLDYEPSQPRDYSPVPERIKGGINVLAYASGARIIQLDTRRLDEETAEKLSPIHDGQAPLTANPSYEQVLRDRQLIFAFPEEVQLSGAMIQLTQMRGQHRMLEGFELAVSGDGNDWTTVSRNGLQLTSREQYFVFDKLYSAKYLRFRAGGCRGNQACEDFSIADIQAIAPPGVRLASSMNVAEARFGGHVVYGTGELAKLREHDGEKSILDSNASGSSSLLYKKKGDESDKVSFVVGFNRNRATRIQDVGRFSDPKEQREGEVQRVAVAYSLESPAGPWINLGVLDRPAEGKIEAKLGLRAPVWARFLRFQMERDAESILRLPAHIKVYEDPKAPSVLGLWGHDNYLGGGEHAGKDDGGKQINASGGASKERAVRLPVGGNIRSSVQLGRNEDWWRFRVPEGPASEMTLVFSERGYYEFNWELFDAGGQRLEPEAITGNRRYGPSFRAYLQPGDYWLRLHEPPRSIVISWDTSGSVGRYKEQIIEAVKKWSGSIKVGREVIQLLPFGVPQPILSDWATTSADVTEALANLPKVMSSDSDAAIRIASQTLSGRKGTKGLVIITDAEVARDKKLWPEDAKRKYMDQWPELIEARPKVISLSIDSDDPEDYVAMMDWASVNGGFSDRVTGVTGLSDGLDMAAALFRQPKSYSMQFQLKEYKPPVGEGKISILMGADEKPRNSGSIEFVLDASGSMLQKMPTGARRIDVAKAVLSDLVANTMPKGFPMALRIFGLRKHSCEMDLVQPLEPLVHANILTKIRRIQSTNLAKTPIAESLRAAARDLQNAMRPRMILLVTDGEETCGGDVEAAIDALNHQDSGISLNVIGFAIEDVKLKKLFANWAEQGEGAYYDAQDHEGLYDAIQRATLPGFLAVQESPVGKEMKIGQISVGDEMTVPAGRIRLEPINGASGGAIVVDVEPETNLKLEYDNQFGIDYLE